MMRLWTLLALLLLCAALPAQSAEKPIIGITIDFRVRDGSESHWVSTDVIDSVRSAGGIPVLLPPIESAEDIARMVDLADGFVFTGGADIDPARYGQEPHPTVRLLHPLREQFEQTLMSDVIESRKPVLGICLGMQQMNIACGGTLIQDIPSLTDSDLTHRGASAEHGVEVIEGTLLRDHLGADHVHRVPTSHHQSVDEPGEGFVISARSSDGIVEGIENPNLPFAIGIQWHAERAQEVEPNRRIFEALVQAAAAEQARRAE